MPSRGAAVERPTLGHAREVRRRLELADVLDEPARVVALVATDGHTARRQTGDQTDRRVALAGTGRGDDAAIDDQAVSILRREFAEIRELGFVALRLPGQRTTETAGCTPAASSACARLRTE